MPGPVVPAVFHVRRARDLIDRRFAEPLDLDAMARAAGFSRYHFARVFKEAYGETPGQYLTRRRVERAQDLLRSADLSVTEVCHLVGFTSLGSFSTRFSELVGASPTEYRRMHAERAAARIPGCFVMAWSRPGTATNSTATNSTATNSTATNSTATDSAIEEKPPPPARS